MRHGIFSVVGLGLGVSALTLCLLVGTAAGQATVFEPVKVVDHAPVAAEAKHQPQSSAMLSDWSARYKQHLFTLADPSMEGRAPGSAGIEKAAVYIEGQLKSFGLAPAFPTAKPGEAAAEGAARDSYRQWFNHGGRLVASTQVVALPEKPDQVFAAGTDFNVVGLSSSAKATGKLVFAGYAINEPDRQWTTFADDANLNGAIVMVLRFEPMTDQGKSKWSDDSGWSIAAGLESKVRRAFAAGAGGVVIVNPPGAADARVKTLETVDSLTSRRSGQGPVVMMTPEAADRLLASCGSTRNLLSLREAADAKAEVIEIGGSVTLEAKIDRQAIETANVGGMLRGKGALADEIVVIGAHYDHLGMGLFGSMSSDGRNKLHPGADDNASGSSGNLLVAEQMAKAYAALPAGASARSVLFLWFSAEESGLNGSRYYTRNMIAPAEKHTIMLNMDMIGSLRQGRLEVTGLATADGLKDFVTPYFDHSGMNIGRKPGGLGPSDHASFFLAKVPVLFFFTGLTKQYHSPADTADTINTEGAAQVCDLVYRLGMDFATTTRKMPYAETDESRRSESPMADVSSRGGSRVNPDTNAAAPSAQPSDPHAAGQQDPNAAVGSTGGGSMRGVKVRFGIAPGDYSGSDPGVLVGDVYPDTSAAAAGLKAGDLITKWNTTEVKSVEDWMPLLSAHEPGDVVKITYVRDGKTMTTEAKLKGRSSAN